MSLREAAEKALEALHIGEIAAEAVAQEYHEAMRGYRPARHDALDRDVETIRYAMEAIRAALAENAKPVAKNIAAQVPQWKEDGDRLEEATKEVLEWIDKDRWPSFGEWGREGRKRFQALRDALAEAAEAEKAEPVAWRIYDHESALGGGVWITDSQRDAVEAKQAGCVVTGLVAQQAAPAHPPAALPESAKAESAELTDEEILELWSPSMAYGIVKRPILGKNKILAFARAVLAAARGKE